MSTRSRDSVILIPVLMRRCQKLSRLESPGAQLVKWPAEKKEKSDVVHFLLVYLAYDVRRRSTTWSMIEEKKGLRHSQNIARGGEKYKSIQTQCSHGHTSATAKRYVSFSFIFFLFERFSCLFFARLFSSVWAHPATLSSRASTTKTMEEITKTVFFSYSPHFAFSSRLFEKSSRGKICLHSDIFLRDLNWSRESLLITWRNSSRGCDGSSSPRPCTHYKLGALFAHESRSCSVQFSFTLSNESRCVFSESIRLRGIAVKTENSHNSLVSVLIRLKNIFLFYVIWELFIWDLFIEILFYQNIFEIWKSYNLNQLFMRV